MLWGVVKMETKQITETPQSIIYTLLVGVLAVIIIASFGIMLVDSDKPYSIFYVESSNAKPSLVPIILIVSFIIANIILIWKRY